MTIKTINKKLSIFESLMQKTIVCFMGAVGKTSVLIGIAVMVSLSAEAGGLGVIDSARAAQYRTYYVHGEATHALRSSGHANLAQQPICMEHPGRCRGYKRTANKSAFSNFVLPRNQFNFRRTVLKDRFITGFVPPIRKIKTYGKINAPIGLQIFCMKNPRYCHGGGVRQIQMTAELMKTLSSTNAKVNRSIRPRLDKNGDVWSINVKAGDCEDYVLSKRARLIALGLPASSLRIATAYTRQGIGHAVLVVRTNEGDYVLDNRRRAIKKWHQTGLRGVALSGTDLRNWKRI